MVHDILHKTESVMLCSGSLWGVEARIPGFLSSFNEKMRKNEVFMAKNRLENAESCGFGAKFWRGLKA